MDKSKINAPNIRHGGIKTVNMHLHGESKI